MSCPLYNDFTRECSEKFEDILYINNFDICDSDRYKKCPFYRVLNEPEKRCEYDDRCIHSKTALNVPFERIMWIADTYCFSENRVNCERYKLIKAGKNVPEDLSADGSRIELKT